MPTVKHDAELYHSRCGVSIVYVDAAAIPEPSGRLSRIRSGVLEMAGFGPEEESRDGYFLAAARQKQSNERHHTKILAKKKRVILSVAKNPDEIRLDYAAIPLWILHSGRRGDLHSE